MSLFGDEDESQAKHSQSLFGDDSTPQKPDHTKSSLFNDSSPDGANDSPWEYSTPRKKKSRWGLLAERPSAELLPKTFEDTFDCALEEDDPDGEGTIGLPMVKQLLVDHSDIPSSEREDILKTIESTDLPRGDMRYNKGELFMLVGLIGLAKQEGIHFTLGFVEEKSSSMPPRVPSRRPMPVRNMLSRKISQPKGKHSSTNKKVFPKDMVKPDPQPQHRPRNSPYQSQPTAQLSEAQPHCL